MKITDIAKRVKELDRRYLEWDFYYGKYIACGLEHYRKKANRAWASYMSLVAIGKQ